MSLANLKIAIKLILTHSGKPLTPRDLLNEFKKIKGYDFPYRKLGFINFLQCMKSRDMSDTVKVQYQKGIEVVGLAPEPKHIDHQVARKKSKLDKVSPTPEVIDLSSDHSTSYPSSATCAQQFFASSSFPETYSEAPMFTSYQSAGSPLQSSCGSSQPMPENLENVVNRNGLGPPKHLRDKVVEFLESKPQGAREDDMYSTLLILSSSFTDYGIKTVRDILDTFSDVLEKKEEFIYLKPKRDPNELLSNMSVNQQPLNASDNWQPSSISDNRQPSSINDSWQSLSTSDNGQPMSVSDSWQLMNSSNNWQPSSLSDNWQQSNVTENWQPPSLNNNWQPLDASNSHQPLSASNNWQPSSVSNNWQPLSINDIQQPPSVSDNWQPTSVINNWQQLNANDNQRPSKVNDNWQPSKGSDNRQLSKASDKRQPSKASDNQRPLNASDNQRPSNVSVNHQPSNASDNQQPSNASDQQLSNESYNRHQQSSVNLSAVFRDLVQPIKDALLVSDRLVFFASTAYGKYLQLLDEFRFTITSTVPLIRDLVSEQNASYKSCSISLDKAINVLKHSFWLLHLVPTIENEKKLYIFQCGIEIFENAVSIIDEDIIIFLSDESLFPCKKELSSRIFQLNDSCAQLLIRNEIDLSRLVAPIILNNPSTTSVTKPADAATVYDSGLPTGSCSTKSRTNPGASKHSPVISPPSVFTAQNNRVSKKERKRIKKKWIAQAKALIDSSVNIDLTKTKSGENPEAKIVQEKNSKPNKPPVQTNPVQAKIRLCENPDPQIIQAEISNSERQTPNLMGNMQATTNFCQDLRPNLVPTTSANRKISIRSATQNITMSLSENCRIVRETYLNLGKPWVVPPNNVLVSASQRDRKRVRDRVKNKQYKDIQTPV